MIFTSSGETGENPVRDRRRKAQNRCFLINRAAAVENRPLEQSEKAWIQCAKSEYPADINLSYRVFPDLKGNLFTRRIL